MPKLHSGSDKVKRIALAVLLSLMTSGAYAASCKVEAGEKKLSGAAMKQLHEEVRNRRPEDL
jgi:hypothetical protein